MTTTEAESGAPGAGTGLGDRDLTVDDPGGLTPEGLTPQAAKLGRQFEFLFMGILFLLTAITFTVHTVVLVGDWDFWTDWKDARWWLTLYPPVTIMFPALVQAVVWYAFRMPIGATFAAVAMASAMWLDRVVNFSGGFPEMPLNFVWPALLIPCALFLDAVLLITKKPLFVAAIGGVGFAFTFWLANHALIGPFYQPVELHGSLMSLADLQGFEYIRASTPEYLRIVERGTLRLALGETEILSAFFGGFLCMISFYLWWLLGSWTVKSLSKKFVKVF